MTAFDINSQNGAAAELLAAAKLTRMGLTVAFPFVAQQACDMIVFDGEKFSTIQIKSGTTQRHGRTRISEDFSKYKHLDFVICYDGPNDDWYIFTSAEISDRRSIQFSRKRHAAFLERWDKITTE